MNHPSSARQDRRGLSLAWRLGLAIVLLFLLASLTTGTVAQGGERVGQPPEIIPDPVILSREVSADGLTAQVTVELPITADTYIASNRPTTNYGSSTWLRLGYNVSAGLGAVRILLRSDLSSIPSDAVVNWARFRIYQHTVTVGPSDPKSYTSRHLNSSWSEYSVTWNSHQPDWGGIIARAEPPLSIGWLESDVTDLIREVLNGTHPPYGVTLLANEDAVERERIFYSRDAGNGLYPRLIIDYSVRQDTEPPIVSVKSLPAWSPQRFTVGWEGTDPGGSGIDYYDVEYRVPGGLWTSWLNNTRSTSAEFVGGANGTTYEFRARGVDKAGNVQPFPSTAQASTKVDSVAPSASVTPLDAVTFASAFWVSWSGSDNAGGSGLKHFDVQWRESGQPWANWVESTTATTAQLTGGTHNRTYEFRARAVDNAGNVQPWSAVAQATTVVDVLPPTASILPFVPVITGNDSFTVRWNGQSSPNTSITYYDVQYQYAAGSWTLWLSQTSDQQAEFTDLQPEDGVYCFRVRATDSAGRLGAYGGQQCIIVDRYPPFVVPRIYMPVVAKDSD